MKVFVTGGTGAVGPHAIRALVAAGHEVTALARSDAKAAQVTELGATPVSVSLFDRDALAAAFTGHDAVINLATAIPATVKYPIPYFWRANAHIRTEGTEAVVDAAIAAGVPRLLQESIALAYPDRGDEWSDETVPLDIFNIVSSTPVSEGHIDRFTRAGGTGVVLRFGLFYGPGSVQSKEMFTFARLHYAMVMGPPNSYFSPIYLPDAGEAVAAALNVPAGVYNVVDDEPVTKREFGLAISAAAGRRPWLRGPGRLTLLPGKSMSAVNRSIRVSNKKIRNATGWAPAHPNARTGWAAAAPQIQPYSMLIPAVIALLVTIAIIAGVVALL